MTASEFQADRPVSLALPSLVGVAALVAAAPLYTPLLPAAFVDYPKSAVVPLSAWVGDSLTWLAREAEIGGLKVQAITRAIAQVFETPIDALNLLLTTGIRTGAGDQVRTAVPPLSWLAIVGLAGLLGHLLGGVRLVAVAVAGLLYIVVFGLWIEAMTTLSSVLLSTAFAVVLGVAVGAFVHRNPRLAGLVEGLMNVMQTVPVFSYLVPTLLFLGYGPAAALVATVVFALPPMVHATMLGLRSVPTEIIEYGHMAGATRRQLFWRIMMPMARPMLGVGLNQTIMACLNMVIIASMIGAGGLGYLVLLALRRLDFGAALEAGLAIVVLAVVLDRLSQAAADKSAAGQRLVTSGTPYLALTLFWIVGATVAALILPALQVWPEAWRITTASLWNDLISWINVNWFDVLDAIRTFTLLNILNPARELLLGLPWTLVVALVSLAGYSAGGPRLAATVAGLALFIAVTGFWDPAIVSVYLVAIGTTLSLLIGLPVGFLIAQRPTWRDSANLALDTLQTLPTLVYILPAVMIFRNGDFAAVLAIVSYAVAPAIRYTMHGFATVPPQHLEAGAMCGATRWQSLKWISLPASFPTLILGVNQTVMMAIAMLVVTALVGTRDLGQQVFIALSRAKVGDGIVGGLAVAALALIADCILKAWAAHEARRIGLADSGRCRR